MTGHCLEWSQPESRDGEEWRVVAGFEDFEVSSLGRVRKLRRGECLLLRPDTIRKGYQRVALRRDGRQHKRLVHVLVLETFVGPRPAGLVARHFPDRDPTNNSATNLSWCTHAENMADKKVHGTSNTGDRHGSKTKPWAVARGERASNAKLTTEQVMEIHTSSETAEALAARLGVGLSTVTHIRCGSSWKHLDNPRKRRIA